MRTRKRFLSTLLTLALLLSLLPANALATGDDVAAAPENEKTEYTVQLDESLFPVINVGSVCDVGEPISTWSLLPSPSFDTNYYTQLDGNSQKVYNALKSSSLGTTGANTTLITVEDIPMSWTDLTCTGSTITDTRMSEWLQDIATPAILAFIYDNPKNSWLVNASLKMGYSGFSADTIEGKTSASVTGITLQMDAATVTAVTEGDNATGNMANIVSAIEAAKTTLKNSYGVDVSSSTYDKVLAIHNYVCNTVTYASGDLKPRRYQTVYSALVDPKTTVCAGYSKAFKVLCNEYSIPCVLVSGTAGGDHMWNYVQIDGKWYAVDCTWDDQTTLSHDFFLVGADTVAPSGWSCAGKNFITSHVASGQWSNTDPYTFIYPVLNSSAYKYVTSIAVKTAPTKTDYVEGENFNSDGMVITVTYSDSSTEDISTGFTVTGGTSLTTGKTSVTISYAGQTTTQAITVAKKSITGIKVTAKPTKLEYTIGETADWAGMVVTATYNDGTTRELGSSEYAVSGFDSASNGTKTITVTASEKTATFTITVGLKALTESMVSGINASYEYTGSAIEPEVTVKNGETPLVLNTDYTVSYTNNTNAGTATVTVTGAGSYGGTVTKNFTITAKPLAAEMVSDVTGTFTYNGSAQTPTVTVTDGGTALTKDTHYTISYTNNTNAGTATVTVKGKDNYSGTITKTFTISAKSLTAEMVSDVTGTFTYNGSAQTPTVTVTDGGTTLTKDTHYTVSYTNNTNAGNATVTVTGKDNYRGTITKNFTISAKVLSDVNVDGVDASYTWTGSQIKPTVTVTGDSGKTLTPDTDYTVVYGANTAVGTGTVTVKAKPGGNYTFTEVTKNFNIVQGSSTISITGNPSKTYNGAAVTDPTVSKTGSGGAVTYTYYTDSACESKTTTAHGAASDGAAPKNVGTYWVKATLAGDTNYTGATSAAVSFTISPAELSSCEITMTTEPAAGAATSSVTASGTNFTVAFSDWKKGSTTVTSFEANTTYTVAGTLTANPNYVFASGATVTLSDTGNGTVTDVQVSEGGATLTFTYKYTTPALPAYSGAAAGAPTLKTKSGGNVTLNAVAVTGETVEYGWSNSDSAVPTTWQTSTDFTGLPVGDYYFYARVKAKENTHSGGGVSPASDKITVFAAPEITGYSGALNGLIIGTSITDITPTVTGGTGTYNSYAIASGSLPAGLNFGTTDGKISGTPTTYAAAGGSVTVTVTDSEGVSSVAYTLNYGSVAKAANTMTSVTQGDVTYGTEVSPSVNACNGTAPTYQYKVKDADDSTYRAEKPTAVGEYTVRASSTGSTTVADATVTANFKITQKPLTNLGFTGVTVSKVYDRTTSAGAVGGSAITFDGKVGSDDVSITAVAGVYNDANAGTGKTVTLTLSLDGAAKDNYSLSESTHSFTTAAITPADYTYTVAGTQDFRTGSGLSAITVAPAAGTGVNSESVSGTLGWYTNEGCTTPAADSDLSSMAAESTKTLYWQFTATNANYTNTPKKGSTVFTAKNKEDLSTSIVTSGITGLDKAYNGVAASYSGSAAVTGHSDLNGDLVYEWYQSDDTKLTEAPKNAGDYYLKVSIPDGNSDYMGRAKVNFTISQREVTVAAGTYQVRKVYDGTTTAGAPSGALSVSGILPADSGVTVQATPAAYTNVNVGGQTSMDVGITLNGDTNNNYKMKDSATTVSVPCAITKAELTIENLSGTVTKGYDGSTAAAANVTFTGLKNSETLAKDTDYTVIAVYDSADAGTRDVTVTVSLSSTAKVNNYSLPTASKTFTGGGSITQATWTATSTTGSAKYGTTGSVDLTNYLAPGGTIGTITKTDGNSVISGTPAMEGDLLKFTFVDDSGKVEKTATITVPVTGATNYGDYSISVTVMVNAKQAQSNFKFTSATQSKTYGNADFTVAATGAETGSTVTYASSDTSVATVDNTGKVHIVKVGTATITATAAATDDYAQAIASYTLTVNKATITITAGSKSAYVGDAVPTLSSSDYTVTGLASGDSLATAPTVAYASTPDMTKAGTVAIQASGAAVPTSGNYNDTITYVDGTLTISSRPYYGGGSSGSSNTSTSTTTNKDGSTTTTTTNKTTGTVTEVTKDKDGTTTTVETKKDGTVTETIKTTNGTTGTVVTDKNGDVTEVKSTVSSTAAREAAKTGEAVTLPVEVPAVTSTEDAPAVQVTVPKASGSVKVEIPVEKVTPGTVAVIVNADGTEKIVSTSVTTENGVALTISGAETVKIIDNSKSFTDVPKSNVFYNEIASLSAREIMVGKTDDKFDLHNSVTLNQIANVAGRIVGAVDVKDYNAGIAWGAEYGLKTGNVAATRGDVLKALYIAAGSPIVADTSVLARFNDAGSIPADLMAAAAWAAQNGILKGNVDGSAGLGNNVTRGQACALAGRTMGTLA